MSFIAKFSIFFLLILLPHVYFYFENTCSQTLKRLYQFDRLLASVGCVKVLTNYATPWSRVVEKLTVPHLVQKFPLYCGTRRFITMFRRARYFSLSWTRWIQSAHSQPFSKSVLILSFPMHLRILSDLFLSWFANKAQHEFLFSPVYVSFSWVYPCNRPNIWRGLQIMNVIIMQFSPVSC
jgi:hypothetical protein